MIKKFTSFENDSEKLWLMKTDVDYYKKMNQFFIMIEKLSGFKVESGIRKISIQEFNRKVALNNSK